MGVAALPPGHSDEPASGLTLSGSVPNAWGKLYGIGHAAWTLTMSDELYYTHHEQGSARLLRAIERYHRSRAA